MLGLVFGFVSVFYFFWREGSSAAQVGLELVYLSPQPFKY